MSSNVHYAVKDRDGKINQEPGKKEAKRNQKAFGGLIVRSKGEGAYKPWKPRKVFLWVFLAIQAAFITWIITAIAGAHDAPTAAQIAQFCGNNQWQGVFTSYNDCVVHGANGLRAAGELGTTIGVGLVIGVWLGVDFLVGLTYGIYRLVKR